MVVEIILPLQAVFPQVIRCPTFVFTQHLRQGQPVAQSEQQVQVIRHDCAAVQIDIVIHMLLAQSIDQSLAQFRCMQTRMPFMGAKCNEIAGVCAEARPRRSKSVPL